MRRSDERRFGGAAAVAYLFAGAVELFVGHYRRALEGEVAIDLDPGAAAVVLVANAHGDRARDPVDPQQKHVERVAALPGEALFGVVRRPDVIGRERVEAAAVVD